MRVEVDSSRCEGHGLCEQTAPGVYELDDEGMVRLQHAELPSELETAAEAGSRVCPVAALRIARAA